MRSQQLPRKAEAPPVNRGPRIEKWAERFIDRIAREAVEGRAGAA